jgi:hypothetical protein
VPADLTAAYTAFAAATAETRDAARTRLIDTYYPFVQAGGDVPGVDKALAADLSPQGRVNLATSLGIQGLFCNLAEECLQSVAAEVPADAPESSLTVLPKLYRALEAFANERPKTPSDWASIAKALRAGWAYWPSALYADKVETAFRKAADRHGLFAFRLYRSLDESDGNIFRTAGLFIRWLFTPKKTSFRAEIQDIKDEIQRDLLTTSPSAATLPILGAEEYTDINGVRHLLSFRDPASELFGKRAVLVFFQTTCPYCMEDLTALAEVFRSLNETARARLSIVGIKMETPLPPPLGALAPFAKGLALPFPLLENSASGMPRAYGVEAVPFLVFTDERGLPLWSVILHGQGRRREKLAGLIHDLLDDADRASRVTVGTGSSSVMEDFYYDPADTPVATILAEQTAMATSARVRLDLVTHPVNGDDASLANRLESLHAANRALPVAIVGGKVLSGLTTMEDSLPRILASARRAEQKAGP